MNKYDRDNVVEALIFVLITTIFSIALIVGMRKAEVSDVEVPVSSVNNELVKE